MEYFFGFATSLVGFAVFWRLLLDIDSPKKRFLWGAAWFTSVQLIQLFWMVYHPFAYIYVVYPLFALLIGMQFGVLSLLVKLSLFKKWISILGFVSLWTLIEWTRLFYFSGYTWNPVGLSLASTAYGLQAASIAGVFGLSFWVIFVNSAALRAWIYPCLSSFVVLGLVSILPFAYGFMQIEKHQPEIAKAPVFTALLVQPAFPAEESMEFDEVKHFVAFVMEEWQQILKITQKYAQQKVDLIALPEYVVPFGTYSFIYPYETAVAAFRTIYGENISTKLPPKELPYAKEFNTSQGVLWAVNNAFWAQGIANIFNAPLIAGLEDAEDVNGLRERYSSAIYFPPLNDGQEIETERYAKRVLVPMAEYIPFSFCQQMAASYGINGSFTCGTTTHIYHAGTTPFAVSICYEETFGNLMTEGRQKGAELLVNLTSDVWFPNSLLPYQHLEHSRLRTVENGIPLLRACNTGITSAINSLGQTVALLGKTKQEQEWSSDCLVAKVPLYSYQTFYSLYGDKIIITTSLCFLLIWLGFSLIKIDPLF